MKNNDSIKSIQFLLYFEKFISDSKTGRRLQPSGRMISKGTLVNYEETRKLLEEFIQSQQFNLRIIPVKRLNQRQSLTEKNYWKKFYRKFTNFLYIEKGYFDNSVGSIIKNIKPFFSYLNKDLQLGVGEFYKHFYVRKEEIPILVLLPEELNFLIYNKEFESALPERLKEAKDFFVFGCTVGLRFSDLVSLKRINIKMINEDWWLVIRTKKTRSDLSIKLPEYAKAIILKYKHQKRKLLPSFNNSNCGKYLKRLMEVAGFTNEVSKFRERRGKQIEIARTIAGKKFAYRFCDLVSTHTMRRTSITTMLCLGVPEQVVRKISGHSPGSKEFYRYVAFSQGYQDNETSIMFSRLKERVLH